MHIRASIFSSLSKRITERHRNVISTGVRIGFMMYLLFHSRSCKMIYSPMKSDKIDFCRSSNAITTEKGKRKSNKKENHCNPVCKRYIYLVLEPFPVHLEEQMLIA